MNHADLSMTPADWAGAPIDHSGTWLVIGILSAIFIWLFLVGVCRVHVGWALLGVALLPLTLVLLVCWATLPVWLTRTILIGGVIDQAFLRGKTKSTASTRRPGYSDQFSRN